MFDFQRVSNTNSSYTFSWWDAYGRVYYWTWRGGSGDSTDACWVNHGNYNNYDGSAIKGRVWYWSDKPCWNGTWRTELFTHTEETAGQGQSCEPFCWDGANDYYSQGCIKIAYPGDINSVHSKYHAYGTDLHGDHADIGNALWVHD